MIRKRRPLRALFLLAVAVAFSLFLSYATPLHRILFQTGLRAIGLRGDFESSRIFLLFGELALRNLRVEDSQGKFHLEAARLRLSVSPVSLLRGQLIISRLYLDDPVIKVNLPEKKTKPMDPDFLKKFFSRYENSLLLKNLSVRSVRLHQLTLWWGDDVSPWLLQDLNLGFESTLFRELKGEVSLAVLERKAPLLESLSLEWSVSPEGLQVKKLLLKRKELTAGGEGEFKGTLQKGRIKISGEILPPQVLDLPVLFNLEAILSDRVAHLERASATLGSATFSGKGQLNTDSKDYSLDFQAQNLPLESIFHKIPGTLLANSLGIAELQGRASGHLPQLTAEADATIRQFRHRDLAADRATGRLRLHGPTLSFEAHIQSREGGPEIGQVTGSVDFKPLPGGGKLKALPQAIDVSFQRAPLEEILPEGKLKGLLSGSLSLQGVETSVRGTGKATVEAGMIRSLKVESLETDISVFPEGKFEFERSVINIGNLEPIHFPSTLTLDTSGDLIRFKGAPSPRIKIAGSYDPKTKGYQFDQVEWTSAAGVLRMSGQINEGLNLQTRGKLDLAALKIFPEIFYESSGSATVEATITGSSEDPSLDGQVELRGGEIELRGLPYSISRLTGRLRLRGHTIASELTGDYGDGQFQLGGDLTLSHLKPEILDLQMVGSSILLRPGPDLFAELNGNVSLKGKWPSPLLSGDVDLVDGRYTREFEIRNFILKPIAGREPRRARTPIWDQVELSLRVKSAGDFQIRNDFTRINLICDLSVGGTYGQPKLKGNLELAEGTFNYFARKGLAEERQFLLTEGRMEFANPYRNEPYLLIRGESEVPPDYLVAIKIEGYLDNLEITLTSVPSRRREDILSLIAFGVTRDELEQSGGFGSSLGRQLAVQEAARPFEGIFSRTLGLDVQVEQSTVGELSPTRFAVGREVTDRLSLEVKTDFSPEVAERTVQANYYLTDNILLKGFRTRTATTAPHYQFNLSLRFRVR